MRWAYEYCITGSRKLRDKISTDNIVIVLLIRYVSNPTINFNFFSEFVWEGEVRGGGERGVLKQLAEMKIDLKWASNIASISVKERF